MGNYGDAFNAAVAAELRAERARKKITFEALASAAGLSKSATMNYFNNKREIPTGSLADICAELGVSPRLIFERAENAVNKH